jgi:hypothetical protein
MLTCVHFWKRLPVIFVEEESEKHNSTNLYLIAKFKA